jgi:hypothetical protein
MGQSWTVASRVRLEPPVSRWLRSRGGALSWPDGCGIYQKPLFRVSCRFSRRSRGPDGVRVPQAPSTGPGCPQPSGGRAAVTRNTIRICNRPLSKYRGTYGLGGRKGQLYIAAKSFHESRNFHDKRRGTPPGGTLTVLRDGRDGRGTPSTARALPHPVTTVWRVSRPTGRTAAPSTHTSLRGRGATMPGIAGPSWRRQVRRRAQARPARPRPPRRPPQPRAGQDRNGTDVPSLPP